METHEYLDIRVLKSHWTLSPGLGRSALETLDDALVELAISAPFQRKPQTNPQGRRHWQFFKLFVLNRTYGLPLDVQWEGRTCRLCTPRREVLNFWGFEPRMLHKTRLRRLSDVRCSTHPRCAVRAVSQFWMRCVAAGSMLVRVCCAFRPQFRYLLSVLTELCPLNRSNTSSVIPGRVAMC